MFVQAFTKKCDKSDSKQEILLNIITFGPMKLAHDNKVDMTKLISDAGYQRPKHGPDCQEQIANFLVTETDRILDKSDFKGKILQKDLISVSEYASRLSS